MEKGQNDKERTEEEKRQKRSSIRKKRVVVVAVIIIVVAIIIAFWGTQPPRSYRPSEILQSPESYEGKNIQVRGIITSHNSTAKIFLLGDTVVNMTVSYTSLPEGFQIGIEMIVKGVLRKSDGNWIFNAQEVLVGHPR